ncbi:MAG: hypothetical protein HOV83_35085 [Catenulispora sp.]|nr:hypothetical protein [Catenulispora sp.]
MNQPAGGRHRRSGSTASSEVASPGPASPNVGSPGLALSGPARPVSRSLTARAPWRLRPRTVRAKVVTLLAVPVVAVMALWALAAVAEVRAAYAERQVAALDKPVRESMAQAEIALKQERAATVGLLTRPAGQAPQTASFASAVTATDASTIAVRAGTAAAAVPIDALSPELGARIHDALAAFDTLPAIRQRVTGHGIADAYPVYTAYTEYTAAIEAVHEVGDVLAEVKAAAAPSVGTEAAAVLGLLAVVVSLPVSVRVGRDLVVELVALRDSALDLAGRRLPAAISRLRAGGTVDLEEVAPLPGADPRGPGAVGGAEGTGDTGAGANGGLADEVGQVAEALAVVQRAALEAAVERAEMVSGVARIFLNLARRSQILVHRQLALLDAMERRVADPAEVEDLFRLDHLATRMRRHAESLIILSGQAPGRGWRRPVPLVDVLRSAGAEVEDFARVDVFQVPQARVAGGAVADLTHLLAELVENATLFSPPDARVIVRAVRTGPECVVEVEDAGLGMGHAALAEANARLADARQSDMFDSDRLGLFVVSRLARRHGVRVLLRAGARAGTVAEVWIPVSVLEDTDGHADPDGRAEVRKPVERVDDVPVMAVVGGESWVGESRVGESRVGEGRVGEYRVGEGRADEGMGAHSGDRHDDVRAERRPGPVPVGANGLPRRVRQSSLSPRLRGLRPTGPEGFGPERGPEPRSPEEARATMAAFQNGWTLGRTAVDEDGGLDDRWNDRDGWNQRDGRPDRDDRRGSR